MSEGPVVHKFLSDVFSHDLVALAVRAGPPLDLQAAGIPLKTEMMIMKTINCWDDLTRYGINPLTGEACGLMYRILCDVTARGKHILEKALGVIELRLPENWNRGSEASPHIGSIMLARELLPFVGVFALLESGCPEVWLTKTGTLVGIERADSAEEVECFKRFHADDLARRFAYSGTAGDRNQHMMSGRVQ